MAFDFEESVTQLIRPPPVQYTPPPRYISKFRDAVRSASMEGKSSHKTLGVPNTRLRTPTDFLRKKSRPEVRRDNINHKHYHIPDYQHKLPAWEKVKSSKKSADEAGDADEAPRRNFRRRNIVNAGKLQPRTPRMYYVDDRRGNSHPLIPSGLYPLYRDRRRPTEATGKKSVDGKNGIERSVSRKINSEERKILSGGDKIRGTPARAGGKDGGTQETPEIDSQSNDLPKPPQPGGTALGSSRKKETMCRYVTDDERAELLYGMKKKFEELMREFQVLPFLTDTPPKAKRKVKMENDLNQLEKDIDLIERHPHIYVYEGSQ